MKLSQSSLHKFFTIKHKDKTYYINYLRSDGYLLNLFNRDDWEIVDENREELNIYTFNKSTKEQVKNIKLRDKLIKFCIKHFNDFQPNYKES